MKPSPLLVVGLLPFSMILSLPAVAQQPDTRPKFRVEIVDGRSLGSDGRGPYVDGQSGVASFGNLALALCLDGRICGTLPTKEPPGQSERVLRMDFTSPVTASGAKNLGILIGNAAGFGAMWRQDKSRKGVAEGVTNWVIQSPLEIPTGSTVDSERVEVRFFLNGNQHILQFGPWTAGEYQQTNQRTFHGDGTDRGRITRDSDTTWTISSSDESLGRLWDNTDPSHPIDRGLYRFSYHLHFQRK